MASDITQAGTEFAQPALPPSASMGPPDYGVPPELMPNYDEIVIEDNAPMDSCFAEKQMRLMCEPLFTSWRPGRKFLAAANVGLFYRVKTPPFVPDVMLSLDVDLPKDLREKKDNSYFVWEFGKPPDWILDIVSNLEGEEFGRKFESYASIGVEYYVIFDPAEYYKRGVLNVFERSGGKYHPMKQLWFPGLDLGIKLWRGEYEGAKEEWLRWCDRDGNLILTGAVQRERAEESLRKAEQASARAERLAAKLKELGIDANGQ